MKQLRVLLWGVVLSLGLLGCQPAGGTEVDSTATVPTETVGTESSPAEPATSTPEAEADMLQFNVGEVFALGGGQEALVGEGLRIRFAEVLEDSRCPTEVECFWTGQARITVVVQEGENEGVTVEFNTNPAPDQNAQTAEVGPYTIELQSLDPYPATSDDNTTFAEYRATLMVTERSAAQFNLGESFVLYGGQEAEISGEGLSLRFDRVVEDSRCPRQVECEWAGRAVIGLVVQEAEGEAVTVELNTYPYEGQQTAEVGPYTIQLRAIDPYPEAPEETIPFESYWASLVVWKGRAVEYGLGEVFTVGGGEEVAIIGENLRLRFEAVLEDSRCPTQVTCVWEGQAIIALVVQVGESEAVEVELNTNPRAAENGQTAEVGGYTITLQLLAPQPESPDRAIAFEEYRATLVVTKG